jgi:hypothetical protein
MNRTSVVRSQPCYIATLNSAARRSHAQGLQEQKPGHESRHERKDSERHVRTFSNPRSAPRPQSNRRVRRVGPASACSHGHKACSRLPSPLGLRPGIELGDARPHPRGTRPRAGRITSVRRFRRAVQPPSKQTKSSSISSWQSMASYGMPSPQNQLSGPGGTAVTH